MAKPATQRVPLASHVQLDSSEPWDAVKAQLLVKISDALNPSPLLFSNYSTTYTIIRIVPKPGYSLTDDATYNFMIERALLAKNPTVNLVIVSKPTAPDAILAVSQKAIADEASKLAAKPGKKARKDPATLPGNVEKGKLIEELRERWSCGQGGCMGNHCYVDPANVHHPLSHERFDVWASAMVSALCSLFVLVFGCSKTTSAEAQA
ncbi:hypothetical protein PLICRDRAFT_294051 [Plicaturopsis crispa FD-325 SS-3]|uniref:Uncharacterized protein n=1 Tax=Plicaturopsis crispa FD-325 SS-3 TaxID=944288 RepID=A0A0C9T3X3_PLICR|nr:hypothetical protein PLICRDRAFT_294051 [Plicaturopsis crispa FD-325 SS-3]